MNDVTLVVLAGGKGSRMGRPKSEIAIGGKPILRYLLDQFQWAGPKMLATAPDRERPIGWELFDVEVTDPEPEMGPMGGIITSLSQIKTEWALFATIDMPRIRPEHLAFLVAWASSPRAGTFLDDGTILQPFPCIIHRNARSLIQTHRSVKSLATLPGFQIVPAPLSWPGDSFTNLNTPEDLKDFQ